MARNVEIKAFARDMPAVRSRAAALSASPARLLRQEDTFFRCEAGRLKLRAFGPNHGELIWYERADEHGPKESTYHITPTSDPDGLRRVLAGAYGVRGVVTKTRELYLVGQTRIHLDEVEGLGEFVELEYVLLEGQPRQEGTTAVESLMEALGIARDDLVPRAYIDLIAGEAV